MPLLTKDSATSPLYCVKLMRDNDVRDTELSLAAAYTGNNVSEAYDEEKCSATNLD